VALPVAAQTTKQSDIEIPLGYSQEEFVILSRIIAQTIYASPIEPARARGVFGFDVGIGLTAVPVDETAPYWTKAVRNDFTTSGYIGVPRLIASKGFVIATVSAMYAKVPDSEIEVWGAALDVPIMKGGLATPTIAIRGTYADLRGTEETYELTTYGVEAFISKGFGPITPYGAVGMQRIDATGHLPSPFRPFTHAEDINRYTVGVRISMLLPKIVLEATQAEERSYSAKVSFGL
jgi:hypothetical protein